jgi:hypothetical protein
VSGGPDVWELARVLREHPDDEAGLERVAQMTGQPLSLVRLAARYYREFAGEVDAWLERVDSMAAALSGQ